MTAYERIEKIGKAKLISTAPSGSDAWHEQRAETIGGSDISIIVGKNPWKSALTLWAEKKQLISQQTATQAMLLGNFLEEGIVEAYRANHPELTVHYPGHTWESVKNKKLHANPDGFIENEFGDMSILEIKFTTQYWKELPEHYYFQVLWYMHITGLHNPATVCAVTGGGYREFIVDYDQSIAKDLQESAEGFLELLRTNTEPFFDGSESDLDTVRQMSDLVEDEIDLDDIEDSVRALFDANNMLEVWEQQVRMRKSQVIKAMNGKRYGYVNGKQVVSLQRRGEGNPYLKLEKGTEWDS